MTERAGMTTAEEITKARASGASWRKVAEMCGLKSPSAARKAYTDLTGIPHYEAPGKVRRAPKGTGKVATEQRAARAMFERWDADSDQDEIIARLEPQLNDDGEVRRMATIVVERAVRSARHSGNGMMHREELRIKHLIGFHFEQDDTKLALKFIESSTGNTRCCYVDDIVEVW